MPLDSGEDSKDANLAKSSEDMCNKNALHIALKTMRDRCQHLQARLGVVEEENLKLRLQLEKAGCSSTSDTNNNDVDTLKAKILQLTKEKSQLMHNIFVVAKENRLLWSRLSKFGQVCGALETEMTKINDTLNQHSSSTGTVDLIRSKTFTKESPTRLVPKCQQEGSQKDDDDDLSLEDISLKLLNNIVREKSELEKQCAQMTEIQGDSFLVNALGFVYLEDKLDTGKSTSEMNEHIEQLIAVKQQLLSQQSRLTDLLKTLERTKPNKPRKPVASSVPPLSNGEKNEDGCVCPVCMTNFAASDLTGFYQHVEEHFVGEDCVVVQY